jgi:membrane protease YdiL (CAAX protease family)
MYGVGLLFFGPIPEELGWRGVLFHDLLNKSFWKAQIYTSSIWFSWHIPLFFIVGSYQYNLGFWSIEFMFWILNIFIQSIIMGYLYVISNKNIILIILFHYFVNLFGEMIVRDTTSEIIILLIYATVLLAIVLKLKTPKVNYIVKS